MTEVPLSGKAKTAGGRALEFLNSNFGLWVLSAIFLSLSPTLLAPWISRYQEDARKREQLERLTTELEFRVTQWAQSSDLSVVQDTYKGRFRDYVSVLALPPSPERSPVGTYGVYPEFGEQTLVALLAHGRSLSDSDGARDYYARAMWAFTPKRLQAAVMQTDESVKTLAGRFVNKTGLTRFSLSPPTDPVRIRAVKGP